MNFSVDVNGWPRYLMLRNIAENLNRLSRAHERYRRDDRHTTDGRAIVANVNVNSRSLKIFSLSDFKLDLLCISIRQRALTVRPTLNAKCCSAESAE